MHASPTDEAGVEFNSFALAVYERRVSNHRKHNTRQYKET